MCVPEHSKKKNLILFLYIGRWTLFYAYCISFDIVKLLAYTILIVNFSKNVGSFCSRGSFNSKEACFW